MFNLIISVISVAVFAILLTAGSAYFDSDKILSIRDKSKIDAAIVKVSTAITAYNLIESKFPRSIGDLVPQYTSEPVLPTGLSWQALTFNDITGEIRICLGGSVQNHVYQALISSKNDAGKDRFIIGSSCGDQEDVVFSEKSASYPVVVTYTIK
ncbi:hypothetical protein D3C79_167110 [compost metagenome]